jgi:hypothetical protein
MSAALIDTRTGWQPDPYRRHEFRYLASGSPTDLVRDGSTEAIDPTPCAFTPLRTTVRPISLLPLNRTSQPTKPKRPAARPVTDEVARPESSAPAAASTSAQFAQLTAPYTVRAFALPLSSLPSASMFTSFPAMYVGAAPRPVVAAPSPAARPEPAPAARADTAAATPAPAASPSELIARALRDSTFFDGEGPSSAADSPRPISRTSPTAARAESERDVDAPSSSAIAVREAALDRAERRLSFGLAAVAVIATLMAVVLFFLM